MEDYLTKLLYHIKDSFDGGANNDISLKIDAEPFMMEADRAVAVGLIVNELATNAFKYAFNGKTGEIHLSLKRHDKTKLLLNFSDNGKGISNAHKENEPSFGLKLVNLMARQLSSKLVAPNKGSTCYTLEIDI
jgi:two-component sensor histidine kinase